MTKYSIMARMVVDINRDVNAKSLAEAIELSKKLEVTHFVQPAKGADNFNDWRDFEIYGVFRV